MVEKDEVTNKKLQRLSRSSWRHLEQLQQETEKEGKHKREKKEKKKNKERKRKGSGVRSKRMISEQEENASLFAGSLKGASLRLLRLLF